MPSSSRLLLIALALALWACDDDTKPSPPDNELAEDQLDDHSSELSPDFSEDLELIDLRPDLDADTEEDFARPDLTELSPSLRLHSLSPASGPSQGNTLVTLKGEGLGPNTQVVFGSAAVLGRELIDANTLQVIAPAGRAGPVSVRVRDGEAQDVLADAYSYIDSLGFLSIEPARSPSTGGVPFVIQGKGFDASTTVSLCAKGVFELQVISEAMLGGITPPCSPGKAELRLSSTLGTVSVPKAMDYFEPLQLERAFPVAGPTAGATRVTLEGRGFDEGLQVLFGNKAAQVEQQSATHAVVISPPHSVGPRDIIVSVGGQSSRIEGGFTYLEPSSGLRLLGLSPARGPSTGGTIVALAGEGFDAGALYVRFGTSLATLLRVEPNSVQLRVPAGSIGPVNVSVHNDLGTAELSEGFLYQPVLRLARIEPARGPTQGGTSVVLEGEGFDEETRVFFGPSLALELRLLDAQHLELLSPPGPAGAVDLSVRSGERVFLLSQAFRYDDELAILGFSPTRGSSAGNTMLTVFGRGFDESAELSLDGAPLLALERLDPYTLRGRSPAHAPAEVDLAVQRGAERALGPTPYSYYDPGTMFGGAWGDRIDGNLNVAVKERGVGTPIEGALVMLGYSPTGPYRGFTDAQGLLTFSGVDLLGSQTVTASKEGYSSTTLTDIDAENLTIYIGKPGEGGDAPVEIEPAVIWGKISGGEKLGLDSTPGKQRMAVVVTSQADMWSPNPNPGEANTIMGASGDYELVSRFGDIAVIGLCGVYDSFTGVFEPRLLAMQRFLFASEGSSQRVDLVCTVPLDLSMRFKLLGAPLSEGPTGTSLRAYLNLGPEGVFGQFSTATSSGDSLELTKQVPLTGAFAGMDYSVMAGAYAPSGTPYSVIQAKGLRDFSQIVELGPMLGVPVMLSPPANGSLVDRHVEWTMSSPQLVDLYVVEILESGYPPRTLWLGYLPGTATSFDLPLLPTQGGAGWYSGPAMLYVDAVRSARAFDFNQFSSLDLRLNRITAWSSRMINIQVQ